MIDEKIEINEKITKIDNQINEYKHKLATNRKFWSTVGIYAILKNLEEQNNH